jgi:hypothetical protein
MLLIEGLAKTNQEAKEETEKSLERFSVTSVFSS